MIFKIILTTPDTDYDISNNISVKAGKFVVEGLIVSVDGVITEDCPTDNKPHTIEAIGDGTLEWIGKGYVGAIQLVEVNSIVYSFKAKDILSKKADNSEDTLELVQVGEKDYSYFDKSKRVSIFTKEFYDSHTLEGVNSLLEASECGIAEEIPLVDNYTYVAVRDCEFPVGSAVYPDRLTNEADEDYKQRVTPTVQDDLSALRGSGEDSYICDDAQFRDFDVIQKTPGEFYDNCVFSRYISDAPWNNHEWKLTLTREGTENFSIKVLHAADNSWWYTPGAFADNGDGTWTIKSWDGDVQSSPQDCAFVFIHGSREVSQIFHMSAATDNFSFNIAYGDSTPDVGTDVGGGGSEWVESGETVVGLVGAAIISVTDSTPFPAGTAVKINEVETTVSYIHSPGILVLATHIGVAGGEIIYVQG